MIFLKALYFALPFYIANMAPVIMKKFPYLGTPIDGGRTINNRRVLGDNKTWRGIVFGTVFGGLTALVQQFLTRYDTFSNLSIMDYSASWIFIFGLVAGFGALVGDAAKSYFKRRMAIPSGQPWIPFDQLDFIAGGLLFTALFYRPEFEIYIILFTFTPFLHWGVNVLSYKLGLKDVPW